MSVPDVILRCVRLTASVCVCVSVPAGSLQFVRNTVCVSNCRYFAEFQINPLCVCTYLYVAVNQIQPLCLSVTAGMLLEDWYTL